VSVKDVGKSECLAVTAGIMVNAITRNGADFQLVFNCKRIWRTVIMGESK
jgi:hypothetical protein